MRHTRLLISMKVHTPHVPLAQICHVRKGGIHKVCTQVGGGGVDQKCTGAYKGGGGVYNIEYVRI